MFHESFSVLWDNPFYFRDLPGGALRYKDVHDTENLSPEAQLIFVSNSLNSKGVQRVEYYA